MEDANTLPDTYSLLCGFGEYLTDHCRKTHLAHVLSGARMEDWFRVEFRIWLSWSKLKPPLFARDEQRVGKGNGRKRDILICTKPPRSKLSFLRVIELKLVYGDDTGFTEKQGRLLEGLREQMCDWSDNEKTAGIKLQDIQGVVFGWWYSEKAGDNKKRDAFDEDWRAYAKTQFPQSLFDIKPVEILEPTPVKGANMEWRVALSAVSICRRLSGENRDLDPQAEMG